MLHKRRTCSRCKRRRLISCWWPSSHKQLCQECALTPDVAFAYSLRGLSVSLSIKAGGR